MKAHNFLGMVRDQAWILRKLKHKQYIVEFNQASAIARISLLSNLSKTFQKIRITLYSLLKITKTKTAFKGVKISE